MYRRRERSCKYLERRQVWDGQTRGKGVTACGSDFALAGAANQVLKVDVLAFIPENRQ